MSRLDTSKPTGLLAGSGFGRPATTAGWRAPDLRRRLRRAERFRKLRAAGLVLPLVAYLLVVFVLPIGGMLRLAVQDHEVPGALPRTASVLAAWDPAAQPLPDEDAFAALAHDLREAEAARALAAPARRLNLDISGYRTLLMGTARALPETEPASWREALIAIDPRWEEQAWWAALRRAIGPWTDFYLLAALDLQRDDSLRITAAPDEVAIYREVLGRTFAISLAVTLLCLLLGYPVAYLLASLPARTGNLLMILVLLPFWTSILVRTAAWIVLLQNEGLVNQALVASGLLAGPVQLVFNRTGVLVAMTHILLPFMVLPLYSVMRGIDPAHMRAAASLGAPPFTAFRAVYLPQTLPGIGAGCLLVFIVSIGYYITPALVGGAADQMIASFIAFYTNQTINWGLAAALGTVLLAAVLLLFALFTRVAGLGRVRLG
jgi:putative spermidine/putrescine transport system permease protein